MRALLLLILCAAWASAEDAPATVSTPPHTWSLGANVLGGQVDYDFGHGHRLEARYQAGQASSGEGTVTTNLFGARAIQRFRIAGVYRPYLGVEGDFVLSRIRGSSYNARGAAFGVLGGLERDIWGRFSAGVDVGPYVFFLNERTTNTSQTSVDVVANVYILCRLF